MARFKKTILTLFPATLLMLTALSGLAAPDKIIDVTKVGVVGDGTTLNTISIQKAIDDCSASGGGTVSFPAGRYLTGTIQIKSNVTLQVEKDATLLGSLTSGDYRNLDPFKDASGTVKGNALIVAVDASNVGLVGGGTVNGQTAKGQPFLVRWVRCTNVTIRDIHLMNPGFWTLHLFKVKGLLIEGMTIRSREPRLRNTDGLDIDSCENVVVRDCDIVSGDDALCIKSTSLTQPSRNIKVTKCKLSTRTNAIKLGTEAIGGFENINISDCQITDTKMAGIALYAVDGGDLRDVIISDITINGVVVPISIRLGARLKAFRDGELPRSTPGELRDVTIKNVTAKNATMVGILINGIPGHPVKALTLDNIHIELSGGATAEAAKVELPENEKNYPEFDMFGKTIPAYGIYARHVRGIKFENVKFKLHKADARPATVFVDVEDVTPANFATESLHESPNN